MNTVVHVDEGKMSISEHTCTRSFRSSLLAYDIRTFSSVAHHIRTSQVEISRVSTESDQGIHCSSLFPIVSNGSARVQRKPWLDCANAYAVYIAQNNHFKDAMARASLYEATPKTSISRGHGARFILQNIHFKDSMARDLFYKACQKQPF